MMTKHKYTARFFVLIAIGTGASCRDVMTPVTKGSSSTSLPAGSVTVEGSDHRTFHVADVEELYDAVNDPANASARIVVQAGTYVLTATDPSMQLRPNGGRLELQNNMSLVGVSGDRSAVIIDARGLPLASLNISLGRTGPVRIGRGNNSVEWLTILGNGLASAGIETDLAGSMKSAIRIANVVSSGSQRGLDVRNIGLAMAGRHIDLEVVANDFSATPAAAVTQGIRFVNMNGADGAVITARLRGNRLHDSQFGCQLTNLVTSNAAIRIDSSGDRFFENALGCFINGGIVTGSTGVADANTTSFEAHGSAFVDNTHPSSLGRGGVLIIGGESPNAANGTSHNAVTVRLWGSIVARNHEPDIEAFAARSLASSGVAGLGNRVRVELRGVSKRIEPTVTPSAPLDPAGSNVVTIIR